LPWSIGLSPPFVFPGGNLKASRADYRKMLPISVVIPTRERTQPLRTLLESLARSYYPVAEVLVIDGGPRPLPGHFFGGLDLPLRHLVSPPSVCKQRNLGVREAVSPWIFLLDDDMEVPSDYLSKIVTHLAAHPEAGAVSGMVLQPQKDSWKDTYPVSSTKELLWKFLFRLGIWGTISVEHKGFFVQKIREYYRRKGNHISAAGWPVLTDFSGAYFQTPVFGLGASVIKKQWLLASPFDETLERHGIGDHYGVAAGFPEKIQVLPAAQIYHHHSAQDRPDPARSYYLRILALDYFRRRPELAFVKKGWLLWSLWGNLLRFIGTGDLERTVVSLKLFWVIITNANPYLGKRKRTTRDPRPHLLKT